MTLSKLTLGRIELTNTKLQSGVAKRIAAGTAPKTSLEKIANVNQTRLTRDHEANGSPAYGPAAFAPFVSFCSNYLRLLCFLCCLLFTLPEPAMESVPTLRDPRLPLLPDSQG
jgi:hypothetical protein